MQDTTQEYDGLLEIPEDEIISHQERFKSKEKEGKPLFPFKYIDVGFGQRCYGFIPLEADCSGVNDTTISL
jgi:hypothetical protein